jgi:cell division protein FtsB
VTGPAGPTPPPGSSTIRARRIIIAGLLTALVLAYVGPVRGYLSQRAELRDETAKLALLEQSRDQLKRQIAELNKADVLEARARAIGLIKPGEQAFIVRGTLDPAPAPERGGGGDGGLFGWLSGVL